MQLDDNSIIRMKEVLAKGETIPFGSQDEMLTAVAGLLASGYQDNLENWKVAAANERIEQQYWTQRIQKEVVPFADAVKEAITEEAKAQSPIYQNQVIKINSQKSPKVIEAGLKAVQSSMPVGSIFPRNATYVVDLKENKIRRDR